MTADTILLNRGLPAQAAEAINRCIASGQWRDWLPSERRLCQELQISRGTLRAALMLLKCRKIIVSAVGRGNQICATNEPRSILHAPGLIGILAPEPLEIYRPYFAIRFDHLQKLASARRWTIQRIHGPAYFGARAERLLPRLVQENPCECWVLMHSNERVQRWFEQSCIPCLVSGRNFPGVTLPTADVDYRASGRHAAGHLLRLGHTRIALLVGREKGPGLIEGEAGFLEACLAHRSHAVRPISLQHDNHIAGIISVLKRQFSRVDRATALVVETSNQYLAAVSVLTQLGLRVPKDVSLISRISDPFLDYVLPAPCRYEVDPKRSAAVIARLIAKRLNGTIAHNHITSIVPAFVCGASTGPPFA